MRRIIYISGPITGCDNYYEHFEEVAEHIHTLDPDCITINPAALIQASNGVGTNETIYERILEMDCGLVSDADAIVMLPGWTNSKGARKELLTALEENIDIFDYSDNFEYKFSQYVNS